jgi:hypothetical protein
MKTWIIITTSLIGSTYNIRKREYIVGIQKVIEKFKDKSKYNIVIVESNSKIHSKAISIIHKTFLDLFGVPILYTKNNLLLSKTQNYGIVEMLDIFDCINHFKIPDDDFIVKITGRYILEDNCPFFDIVDNLDKTPYSAVLRFGQIDEPFVMEKYHTCTTGLIGLMCKHVKKIQIPQLEGFVSIEIKWAEVICKLDYSEICILKDLGLMLRPRIFDSELKYIHV